MRHLGWGRPAILLAVAIVLWSELCAVGWSRQAKLPVIIDGVSVAP